MCPPLLDQSYSAKSYTTLEDSYFTTTNKPGDIKLGLYIGIYYLYNFSCTRLILFIIMGNYTNVLNIVSFFIHNGEECITQNKWHQCS